MTLARRAWPWAAITALDPFALQLTARRRAWRLRPWSHASPPRAQRRFLALVALARVAEVQFACSSEQAGRVTRCRSTTLVGTAMCSMA